MKQIIGRLLKRGLFVLACLITLGLIAWQFENFRGRHAWRKHKAAAEAKGEALDIQSVIPPAMPDVSNFAAIPFFTPLFDFKPGTQEYKDEKAAERVKDYFKAVPGKHYEAKNPVASNTWVSGFIDPALFIAEAKSSPTLGQSTAETSAKEPSAPAAEQTLAYIAQFDEALTQMEQAAERPRSRFPIAYEHVPSISVLLPHLAVLRNASRVISIRCAARLELGQTDAAARDVALVWRLADAIQDEPILISYLVRAAILQHSIQAVADGLSRHAWSDAQLEMFQRELLSRNLFADLKATTRGEQIFFGVATIDQMRRGLVRSQNIGLTETAMMPGVLTYLPDGWFYFEMINYHKTVRAFSDLFSEDRIIDPDVFERTRSDAMKVFSGSPVKRVFNHSIFSTILLPAMDGISKRTAKGQTGLHLAVLACALERHFLAQGSYPESLDQLVPLLGGPIPRDVIKGQPLHYRVEGANSYSLYSVGWDGQDQGGQVLLKKTDPDKEPDHDWVWRPVPRG